jgi:hypothetical protein
MRAPAAGVEIGDGDPGNADRSIRDPNTNKLYCAVAE